MAYFYPNNYILLLGHAQALHNRDFEQSEIDNGCLWSIICMMQWLSGRLPMFGTNPVHHTRAVGTCSSVMSKC